MKTRADYGLMPLRFSRLRRSPGHFVVTSEGGEAMLLNETSLNALAEGCPLPEALARDLEARQMIVRDDGALAKRLLATKLRTRKSFLRGGPALHIFVVTLSCDHSCKYCQVSRTVGGARMSPETAAAGVLDGPNWCHGLSLRRWRCRRYRGRMCIGRTWSGTGCTRAEADGQSPTRRLAIDVAVTER